MPAPILRRLGQPLDQDAPDTESAQQEDTPVQRLIRRYTLPGSQTAQRKPLFIQRSEVQGLGAAYYGESPGYISSIQATDEYLNYTRTGSPFQSAGWAGTEPPLTPDEALRACRFLRQKMVLEGSFGFDAVLHRADYDRAALMVRRGYSFEESIAASTAMNATTGPADGTVFIPPVYEALVTNFANQFNTVSGNVSVAFSLLENIAHTHARNLWTTSTQTLRNPGPFSLDDRPVYLTRLRMRNVIRDHPTFAPPAAHAQRDQLLASFENLSRGRDATQLGFQVAAADRDRLSRAGVTQFKKILISGFDPFSSSSALPVSNPSGAIAMLLDGTLTRAVGHKVGVIEAMTFPTRYSDFNAGVVEQAFRPWLTGPDAADMILTISLDPNTATEFFMERYVTRTRGGGMENERVSAATPGYQDGVATHGSTAPEWLETQLPWGQILRGRPGRGRYHVGLRQDYDQTGSGGTSQTNTLSGMRPGETEAARTAREGIPAPQSSMEMDDASGGNYLSNEISYRVLRLRTSVHSTVPAGHLHIPHNYTGRFHSGTYSTARTQEICDIIKRIIEAALPAL